MSWSSHITSFYHRVFSITRKLSCIILMLSELRADSSDKPVTLAAGSLEGYVFSPPLRRTSRILLHGADGGSVSEDANLGPGRDIEALNASHLK